MHPATKDFSRPIEEERADAFSVIVREEVRATEGFSGADPLSRDAMLLAVAQRFIGEDGGFFDADDGGDDVSGEMVPAPFSAKVRNTNVMVLGYAPIDSSGRLTLFAAKYEDDESVKTLAQSEFKSRIERALRFFRLAYEGDESLKEEASVAELAAHIDSNAAAERITSVRVVFVTNLRLTSSDYDRHVQLGDIDLDFDVYDVDRLYRASDQSIEVTDIDVDFDEWPCGPLPCLEATGKDYEYKSYLLMLDGATLASLYRRFGSRLYDTNLRSYLENKTKVNKGMLETIKNSPRKFLAYNNGLTATAFKIEVATEYGQPRVKRIVGLQIVNGAQTTSTIYKASTDKKQKPDLTSVHVVMKLTKVEPIDVDTFVPEITEYANTQNPIKGSDLQANKMLHRRLAFWAGETWCVGHERQWFYERTRGAYQAAFAREGTTIKKKADFKKRIPPSNRFDKTDLAKYYMAWAGRPHIVSKGAQKNFTEFTKLITSGDRPLTEEDIDQQFFRNTVAKAIVYEAASKAVNGCAIPNIAAMVKAYLVAYLSNRFGEKFRLDTIWNQQSVSPELKELLTKWAPAVNEAILSSNAEGRLLTEWCKQDNCWVAVKALDLPNGSVPLPELAGPKLNEFVDVGTNSSSEEDESREGADQEGCDLNSGCEEDSSQQKDDIEITRRLSSAHWRAVANWLAEQREFSSRDESFAMSMAQYALKGWPNNLPSSKQARWAARLARSAERAGVLTFA